MPDLPMLCGSCLFSPSFSYLSMQPFTQDLYRYVQERGSMCSKQACEVAGTVVSADASESFVQA